MRSDLGESVILTGPAHFHLNSSKMFIIRTYSFCNLLNDTEPLNRYCITEDFKPIKLITWDCRKRSRLFCLKWV